MTVIVVIVVVAGVVIVWSRKESIKADASRVVCRIRIL